MIIGLLEQRMLTEAFELLPRGGVVAVSVAEVAVDDVLLEEHLVGEGLAEGQHRRLAPARVPWPARLSPSVQIHESRRHFSSLRSA